MLILVPARVHPLQDAITAFDFLNVQLLQVHTRQHLNLPNHGSSGHQDHNPKIKILYADPKGNGYVDSTSLPDLFKLVSSDPAFGGAMVWDAGWSQNNLVPMGKATVQYSEAVYLSLSDL